MIDEATLRHHYQPKFIIYLTIHSCCVVRSVGFYIFMWWHISPMIVSYKYYIFHCPKKSSVFCLVILFCCCCCCWVASVVSNSVRLHRWKLTRLLYPWDSPGRSTGMGCHFLLQCMKVKSDSEVAQLCPAPSDPMDCSLPGSSVHGIFQARVLEWGAIVFSCSYIKK